MDNINRMLKKHWRFGKAKETDDGLLALSADHSPFLAVVRSSRTLMPDVLIEEEIGAGCGGHVFKGEWKGARVAVKQILHETIGYDSNLHTSREALFSLASSHPNVVATYKVVTAPVVKSDSSSTSAQSSGAHSYCLCTLLVMEYCEGGSLEDRHAAIWELCKRRPQEGIRCILTCLRDIAAGMEYLHSIGIVHGDLKSSNVLCRTSKAEAWGYHCVISDFGLSRFVREGQEGYTQRPGAVLFAAPEKMLAGVVGTAGDVFSIGMIAWVLISGVSVVQSDIEERYKASIYTWRPDCPAGTPVRLQELIHKCWTIERARRPTCTEVRQLVSDQLQEL